MKKSYIALAIGALAAGAAQAGVVTTSTGAATLEVNPNGIGHKLVVPYYTVQNNNATLLNIVNHDQTNGKAVKIRFRGAANSDDVFDFTLLLSPGDVWTAAITADADGTAKLTTADNSCTLPAKADINRKFVTTRLDPYSSKSVAEQTREGYVEIINMADITKNTATTSLWYAVKHNSSGVPNSCGSSVVTALLDSSLIESSTLSDYLARGLENPSTGLSADWIIINQTTTAAWSGQATALEARDAAGGRAEKANLVFFPQIETEFGVSATTAGQWTADPLLAGGTVKAQPFDFPDLSTPYSAAGATTANELLVSTRTLAKTSVANEFVTSAEIAGATDFVFSQPLRRYYVAVNYMGGTDGKTATQVPLSTSVGVPYGPGLTTVSDRVVCLVRSGSQPTFLSYTAFNREEATLSGSTSAVVSPGGPGQTFRLCGEVAVTSINAGSNTAPSALGGTLARNNIELPYADGWFRLDTDSNGSTSGGGLPIIGNAHLRAANGPVNYGFTWGHKYNY
ncbi:hypothetical protein A9O67_11420 [Tepidimonas fonticaldi]|uniref:Cell surface protein n=1 Tax=Tepidimonas fonticaldi TaxID=1101373 RepID=A0A1A6DYR8_9BURK|nr:hypothetical protein [Tepidimonas fonticaldi]OBS31920.1 hypothetical protein A9O67_11420 [Tepidimonas fonticaldi]